jgi:hypothetical protein
VFWWRKSGNKGTSRLVSPSHETLECTLFGFSKQFQKSNSRKLISRVANGYALGPGLSP